MKKILSLFVILIATCTLWAGNVITYTAYDKLEETTNSSTSYGLHINAFNVSITSHTFANDTGTITFSEEVTSIGKYAFLGCTGLTSVTIDNSVTSIGDYAFYGCSGLTSITIPYSVTSIGNDAFDGCSGLTSIVVESGNSKYDSRDNCNAIIETANNTLIVGCPNTTIPNSVTSIGEYAFRGCSGLTSITIPNSVTSIGGRAFSDCSGLTSITIPNSVTSIGSYAFAHCSGLTSITIPNSVTSIGNGAFSGCSSLTSITIPEGVTSIGVSAFIGCTSLTSITIPNSVTSIGGSAFKGCEKLKTVYNLSDLDIIKGATTHGYVAYYADNVYKLSKVSITVSDIQQGKVSVTLDDRTIPNDTVLISGTNLAISATPSYGYHFSQWSDGNTENPRNIVLTEDKALSARFDRNTYSLSFFAENGSVIGKNSGLYKETVTITATPAYGYHFTQWSDGNTANPRTIVLTQDTAFTAGFEKNTYTLSLSAENGSVSGKNSGLYQETIAISATPAYGYHFIQWSDGNTTNPRTIVLTQDTIITAEFGRNSYSITLASSDLEQGKVSNDTTALYQDLVAISATPAYGYHFTQWSDGNTANPRSIVLTQDTAFTAGFEKNTYTLSLSAENGSVSGKNSGLFQETVAISATPAYGYHFIQWSDGNTANPRSIVLTQDTIITAEFGRNSYSITLASSDLEQGKVSNDTTALYQDLVAISATPAYGYHFIQWSDGNTANPRSIVLTQDTAFAAEFGRNSYSITLASTNPEQGKVSNDTTALYQDLVTIVAIPEKGFQFNGWSDGSTENPRVVTLTQDMHFVATFGVKMCTLTIVSNMELAAYISGAGTYAYGTEVSCIYYLQPNYRFVNWGDGSTANPYRFKIYDDMTLDIFFEDASAPQEKDSVVVTPGDNNADIQWPQVENAMTYTMTINKDGKTILTMTFNGQGQLVNINITMAPALATSSYETQTATGFSFNVTGLSPGTTYSYSIEARDKNGELLSTETGTFTTTGEPQAVENVVTPIQVEKFLRNGQILIQREGKLYDLQGQVVR